MTKGTKEWAQRNENCYQHCRNGCRYCYAMRNDIRFRHGTPASWLEMKPNLKSLDRKKFIRRTGRVMFPTAHDLFYDQKDVWGGFLSHLINTNDEVLITTKPDPNVINWICHVFLGDKDKIQFRFTITSYHDKYTKFWEPFAPLYEKRFDALRIAFDRGFKTSISMEPFLDDQPEFLVERLKPYVTESIWIGPMNFKHVNPKEFKLDELLEVQRVKNLCCKKQLTEIYTNLKGEPLIRFKDGFIEQMNK